jgi:hypothetical protein
VNRAFQLQQTRAIRRHWRLLLALAEDRAFFLRIQWAGQRQQAIFEAQLSAVSQAFTFNDGSGTPMPKLSTLGPQYIWGTAPENPPPPFNVQRLTPIAGTTPSTQAPGDTATTNAAWKAALSAQGSVWQFYQLTMTQWPVPDHAPSNDATPTNTFPTVGANTAFANTTLETFDQQSVFASCMACHNSTRNTDFIWSLAMNAGTPKAVTSAAKVAAPRAKALNALEKILKTTSQ